MVMTLQRRVACFVFFLVCTYSTLPGCKALCLGEYSCTCETQSQGIIINCRSGNLDHVPVFQNDNPSQLFVELTLQNNKITNIGDRAFANLRLGRLLLSGNPIGSVADGAFAGLEADLTELALGLEPGAEFPTAAIQPLKQLRQLDVMGYGKSSLPTGALQNLTNLETLAFITTGLQQLSASDLVGQKDRLLSLDLSSNQFTEIPVAAINSLKSLSILKMSFNRITAVAAESFLNLSKLQVLELSYNALNSLDSAAFVGLEANLQNLTMQFCHLYDQHLTSLRLLRSLTLLDLSSNAITRIDGLLGNMKSIQVLNLARNQITSVSRSVYRVVSSSLLVLDLTGNPITEIAADAFLDLHLLQELFLDHALGLQLDENSFQSQRNSLKLLSLRNTNLSQSQWTSINNLTDLFTLWMSDCELGNIPDFNFRVTNELENIDLTGNKISSISQRSLTGLEHSLVRLYLGKNQLTTLDECVFYRFTKIDILKLQLTSNPLRCDCDMRWLHVRVEELKKNPNSTLLANSLRWTCDNGRLFVNLTNADFASCSSFAKVCEDFTPPQTTTVLTSNVSTSSIVIVTEKSSQKPSQLPLILGVSLGVGIPLIVILIVVVAVSVKKSKEKKRAFINSPHEGDQTKRFIKPNDISRANSMGSRRASSPAPRNTSPTPITSDEVIAHTIHTMSDEEKFRLVNLLTNSRGSVEILNEVGLPNPNKSNPFPDSSKHIYEEIPDDYYEEIPTDDTV